MVFPIKNRKIQQTHLHTHTHSHRLEQEVKNKIKYKKNWKQIGKYHISKWTKIESKQWRSYNKCLLKNISY